MVTSEHWSGRPAHLLPCFIGLVLAELATSGRTNAYSHNRPHTANLSITIFSSAGYKFPPAIIARRAIPNFSNQHAVFSMRLSEVPFLLVHFPATPPDFAFNFPSTSTFGLFDPRPAKRAWALQSNAVWGHKTSFTPAANLFQAACLLRYLRIINLSTPIIKLTYNSYRQPTVLIETSFCNQLSLCATSQRI
ncbi:uncharacterized protein LACBIDRAFT_330344 [Laccaria bicolor S238N-H82]|uniref:Predicted protein n=1 Tax=Laccaria bicolor (strain S238N-H82 / ATCC MYA-4686) TaxID=486041 RepID=B0DL03_LACBS|nr:uncharacterized protein LACBIDRAFT_330344 [Laccaria bicolor S238N-H82]EDR04739.1 predicted protein [Laccaria bicolor S238N-H82]|eukprot:XP_001884563.1 predicted protein [Laccaria bicolor S238N-H82]